MNANQNPNNSFGESISPSERLTLVTICLDTDAGAELRQFVRGAPFLTLQAEVHTYLTEEDVSLSWMQPPGPDICLIDFDHNRPDAILTAEHLKGKVPGTAIFAISSNSQPNLIIEAMRCGCSEYIVKPADREQLLEAMARVGGRKREKREHDQVNGQVLSFIGAKGGSGVTTVATHLGALLARPCAKRTLLIDLHPTCGEAALFLGQTRYQYHFYELAENVERLDSDLLQSYVLHHPTGLDILAAPNMSEPEMRILADSVGQVIDFIRTKYEFVLVDCPPGLTEQNMQALRRSDRIYVITVPEVPALRNVARLLDYFNRHEFSSSQIEVVVNRHHAKNSAINDAELEKAIRKKIFWKVPNQYQKVIRTINSGDPAAQLADSEVARSILAWAESLGLKANVPSEKKKGGKSILSLFGG